MLDIAYRLGGTEGAILVVRAPRGVDHESAEPLRDCVAFHMPNRDGAGVVLDMSEVEMISSIGIAALLQVVEHCRDRGAAAVLAGLPERQRAFLAMLRIDAKFELCGSVDEALARLG